ncbi:tRNA (adenosine(37)-N6)-threonylcarbamoyltransferase complex dimerization subunit type 1 TsaB [Legionella jordanis]|uniref:tRNA threonylcarbamoyladenosine biosynthesis protein TsaB n=1 Tax=Legionella jordanis TaxID=456 RepID=A0A0W0VE33_9GAMM|nr:tRNA (adenosine(37)-N6)-threonylcarbamoyltransferase complex dimerization subunit type 1 TsaB [Legionella jordanis]KTD18404.1 O-sialoglycoprotein endopeptidase [Legionella jordanis]RMX05310.1 tRNA (adenosine(37)-N6)-threonylcarbamoyltransferase complex dimerization subunit type 1 TsaB [Legionella jordanis]RMX20839.1 tRNA (adenosine(37)-N6)-threonylcarbamoyltransferase complex dimerization subunit type 1 TsaB [Legionella jordanis]VEH13250.1 glycoprotease (O-sialoglycoprotein endopeptidase) [L
MNLLAIDTTTENASIALSLHGEIKTMEQGAQRQHAQRILPMIEQLMAETDCALNQLDGIVYGRGPGSFTGLRIACSIAKGLAYAYDLPLFPISSLAAIAEQAFSTFETTGAGVLSLIDARMNQVYWAYFENPSHEAEEFVTDISHITLSSREEALLVAGVGFEPYLEQLSSDIQQKLIGQMCIYPKARAMIQIAERGRIKALSAAEASPVYIRNQVTQGEPRG